MSIVAYEANGKIRWIVRNASAGKIAEWEAEGMTVIEAAIEPGEIDNAKVEEGEPVPRTEADRLPDAIKAKLIAAEEIFNLFLLKKPDGLPRYSVTLRQKLSLYASTPEAQSVMGWMEDVGDYYQDLMDGINDAETLAALDTVDISYDGYESRFGVETGTVSPDPDVYSKDVA